MQACGLVTHSELNLKLVPNEYLVRVLAFISKVFTIFHVLSIELVCKGETHQHRHLLNLQSIQPLLTGLSVDFPASRIDYRIKRQTIDNSLGIVYRVTNRVTNLAVIIIGCAQIYNSYGIAGNFCWCKISEQVVFSNSKYSCISERSLLNSQKKRPATDCSHMRWIFSPEFYQKNILNEYTDKAYKFITLKVVIIIQSYNYS